MKIIIGSLMALVSAFTARRAVRTIAAPVPQRAESFHVVLARTLHVAAQTHIGPSGWVNPVECRGIGPHGPFVVVHPDHLEVLRGLRVSSYEIHESALKYDFPIEAVRVLNASVARVKFKVFSR